ncbi:MAG: neutral zinc metallopeptidase [Bacteroidales bacterium]|nr:neutral zinc metallopeptidase [Bacteroidales bacterium]
MQLDGRRESTNVQDRRGSSAGKAVGGLGIGGILIYLLISFLSGGNIDPAALQEIMVPQAGYETGQNVEFTPEEQALASFSKKILAGTEDIWSAYFAKNGLGEYRNPTMVLYTGATQSGCGTGQASMGPFYCSADECLYIDLSFFSTMKQSLGADGDFAYAYVIAHEVGHHVENLLGVLGEVHQQMNRAGNKAKANQLSVRLELFADFLAGVWAANDNSRYHSLEDGDIEEAIQCAEVIGDNYLQKKAQGYVVEEAFTHGTSAQRMKWLKKGLTTGDIKQGYQIFQIDYNKL